MKPEERKQAEEILRKEWSKVSIADYDERGFKMLWEDMVIKAMESYASLKLAEATKDMYPKEFLRWVVYEQETFEGELCEQLITNHHGRFKSLDELFEYWKQNISK